MHNANNNYYTDYIYLHYFVFNHIIPFRRSIEVAVRSTDYNHNVYTTTDDCITLKEKIEHDYSVNISSPFNNIHSRSCNDTSCNAPHMTNCYFIRKCSL